MMIGVFDGDGHCATFTMPDTTFPVVMDHLENPRMCGNELEDVGKRWVFVVNQDVGSEI